MFGQEVDVEINPLAFPSPNAASLMIFNEVPVDYHTGLPSVNIPLYTIKCGNLKVPLNLSYHNSGFKPNQYESWVGLGWTFNSGGSISRSVKGLEDEHFDENKFESNLGYFYNTDYLDNNWTKFVFELDWHEFIDTEPDVYNFNFGGYTGKFFLDQNKVWRVQSAYPIKIVFDEEEDIKDINEEATYNILNQGQRFFYRFTLITPDGTRYIFGGNRDAIEFTRNETMSASMHTPVATTWNLTKIISANGKDIIEFKYERNDNDLILQVYQSFSAQAVNVTDASGFLQPGIGCKKTSGGSVYSSSLIEPSYLKEVITNNQIITLQSVRASSMGVKVPNEINLVTQYSDPYSDIRIREQTEGYNLFNYSHDVSFCPLRKLSSINIYDNLTASGTPQITISLNYIENSNERLKLDFLDIHAFDGSKLNYDFEYYLPGNGNEPTYTILETDHWGYWNDTEQQIPDISTSGDLFNFLSSSDLQQAYRNSRNSATELNLVNVGVLKKVTYPTKGWVEFKYEQNSYSERIVRLADTENGIQELNVEENSSNIIAGGVRIKQITNSEGILKEYFYVKDYDILATDETNSSKLSSGQLQNQVSYIKSGQFYSYDDHYLGDFYNFSASSYFPILNENGRHIVYSEVSERIRGNGLTKNYYSVPEKDKPNYHDELPIAYINNNLYGKLTSKQFERGKLRKTEVYNENGDVIKEKEFLYNYSADKDEKAVKTRPYSCITICEINTGNSPYFEGGFFHAFGTANKLYYYNYFLEQEIDKTFTRNGEIVQTKTYNYHNIYDKLLKSVSEVDSKGQSIQSIYTYPQFIGILPTEEYIESLLQGCLDLERECNIQKDLCEIDCLEYVKDEDAYNNCLSYCPDCEYNCVINNNPPISQETKPIFKMMDQNIIKPLEIIQKVGGNTIFAKYFDYGFINEEMVKPLNTYHIETNQPITGNISVASWNSNSGILSKDSRYNLKTNLQYDDYGNLLQYHKEDDINVSYLWGYNDTYPIAKVENAKVSEVYFTSYEDDPYIYTPNGEGTYSYSDFYKTGDFSLKTVNPNSTECFYRTEQIYPVITIPTKFKFSVWVYSSNPSAQIYLFWDDEAGENWDRIGYNYATTTIKNQWFLLEGEATVPAGTRKLYMRVDNNGSGTVWFDDLRMYPSDAHMTTYTYDPLVGMTSATDARNRITYYIYDDFGRLKEIKDQEDNVLEHNNYHYAE